MPVKHSVLNVKAVVAAFKQEKALGGAFYVSVQLRRLIVHSTSPRGQHLHNGTAAPSQEIVSSYKWTV